MRIAFGGRIQKKRYSNSGVNRMFRNVLKDRTTYTDDADRFIKKIASELNMLSSIQGRGLMPGHGVGNKPAILVAVNLGGGAGLSIANILAAANGSNIPYEQSGINIANLKVTDDLKATLIEAVVTSSLTNASTIELIDMSTAGSTAMAVGAAAADAILIIALDSMKAVHDDRVGDYKTTIEGVGLEGFDSTVGRFISSRPTRGYGYGDQLHLEYLKRAAMEVNGIHNFAHEMNVMPDYVSYVANDHNVRYDVTEIWHEDVTEVGNTFHTKLNQIIFLVPVNDSITKASLNANIGVLIASCPNVTYFGDSTAATPFA
jgi:hypothetical protein